MKKNKLFINALHTGSFFFPIPDGFNLIPASSTVFAVMVSKELSVSANVNVPSNCNFTGSSINLVFGNYDPVGNQATTPKDSNAIFSFRCTKGGSAFLALDLGDNASGSARRMKASAHNEYLQYELYKDAARSSIWGTGANVLTYLPNQL